MSGTGITAFLQDLAAGLVADSAVQAFCSERFGKRLRVQIGQSAEANPTTDECPIAILIAGSRGTSDDGLIRSRSIRIGLNIEADGSLMDVSQGVKIIAGMPVIDELSDLVEKFFVSFAQTAGVGIVSTPSGGPEDMIENSVFKSWLALGVQLDSDYRT